MKNKRVRMGIGAGGPTIIMVFVSLCLATLATLALVTAHADLRLAVKTAGSIQAYYEADSGGAAFLSQADAILQKRAAAGTERTVSTLAALPETGVSENPDGSLDVSYRVPIDDRLTLSIQLTAPGRARSFDLTEWKVVITEPWNYEEHETEFEDILLPS